MRLLPVVVLLFLFCFPARGSSPPDLVLSLESKAKLTYITKVSSIPSYTIDAIKIGLSLDQFHIADKGGPWNETDIATKGLPFRRLIWAVEVKKHFVIHYESGGIGYSTHFLVISPEGTDGKRILEWAAVSFKKAADLKVFLDSARRGDLESHPAFLH